MSDLQWTGDRPDQAGEWWIREVTASEKRHGYVIHVVWMGDTLYSIDHRSPVDEIGVGHEYDVQFAGPIPKPQEPN